MHPDPLDPPFLLVSGPAPPPDLRRAHIAEVGGFPGPNDEGSGTAAPAGRMDPDPKGIHLPDHRGQPDEAKKQAVRAPLPPLRAQSPLRCLIPRISSPAGRGEATHSPASMSEGRKRKGGILCPLSHTSGWIILARSRLNPWRYPWWAFHRAAPSPGG